MNIFLSYNRDELFKDRNVETLISSILLMIEKSEKMGDSVYFDDLKNDGFTDPAIFDKIENFISQNDTVFLLVSDSPICYGWAEREILAAIQYKKPIKIISIRKFLKILNNTNYTMLDIYNRSRLFWNDSD